VNQRLRQVSRYGVTAGTAALADLGGFVVLDRVGLPVVAAAALSFLLATLVNYGLTARFVFLSPLRLRGYVRFLVAATAGFAVNVSVTLCTLGVFDLPPICAKLAGIGVAFFANFVLNTIFVFPGRPCRPSQRR
jgi:putative flippase GtrA